MRGHCLCGGISFAITPPTKFVVHCHCESCRRAHGAPLYTSVGVRDPQFRVLAGAELLTTFESSPGVRRSFCSRCGSPMLYRSERWPGQVHVSGALIDGPLDRAPQGHVNYGERLSWVDGIDSLGEYE